MLTINKSSENNKAVLSLAGRLDTVTAPDFDKTVREVIPGITELELDLKKLEYISSAGLRVLLTAQKIMNTQGTMSVCNVNETVMEIFDVTGFSDILTIKN